MVAHDQSGTVEIEILEGLPAVGVGDNLCLQELFPDQVYDDKTQLVVVLGDEKAQRGRMAQSKAGRPNGSKGMHVRSVTARRIELFISSTRSARFRD